MEPDIVDITNEYKKKTQEYKIDAFSDENLKFMDDVYYRESFDGIKSKSAEICNIKKNQIGGGIDMSYIDKIYKTIKSVKKKIMYIGKRYYKNYSYKYLYHRISLKKTIQHIRDIYKIDNKNTYIYYDTNVNLHDDSNIYNYTLSETFVNKRIQFIKNNDMIIYGFDSSTYKKHYNKFIEYIVRIVNNLQKGDTIVIYHIFSPFGDMYRNMLIMYLYCFEKVDIIYSSWCSGFQNVVFFILRNKINNITIKTTDTSINYNIIVDNEEDYTESLNKMLKMCLKIFARIRKEVIIQKELTNMKYKNEELYMALNDKIVEKFGKLFSNDN